MTQNVFHPHQIWQYKYFGLGGPAKTYTLWLIKRLEMTEGGKYHKGGEWWKCYFLEQQKTGVMFMPYVNANSSVDEYICLWK